MKSIKNELQNIIKGDGLTSGGSLIKTIQIYLKGNERTGKSAETQKHFKNEEEEQLLKII